MLRVVAFAVVMLAATPMHATQIIPTGVEYTNDTIELGGKLQACVVTTAIISPPAPEIVNFQLLVIAGRPAFKVAAGEVNWNKRSSVAKRILAADFSTGQFNHPSAFKKSITPEGQLLGILVDPDLNNEFIEAFFDGHYSIHFKRDDINDDHIYYIEQSPAADVREVFTACIHSMSNATR